MFERRPILGFLVLLTICVSIWRISVQEPSMLNDEYEYTRQAYVDHQKHMFEQKLPAATFRDESLVAANSDFHINRNVIDYFGDNRNKSNNAVPLPPPAAPSLNQLNLRQSYKTSGLFDNVSSNSSSSNSISHSNIIGTDSATRSFDLSSSLSSSSLSKLYINSNLLPKNDFNRLIDLNEFQFLINQPSCRPSRTKKAVSMLPMALILVHSAPDNSKKRLLIRETWGSVDSPHLRLIFLLGSVKTDHRLQQKIEQENEIFSDIVQGNFVDGYKNMTYKHVMAFKWFIYYCPEAEVLVKVDDDVFVNTLQILEYIESSTVSNKQRQQLLSASASDFVSSSSNTVITLSPTTMASSLQAPPSSAQQKQTKNSAITSSSSSFTPRTYHVVPSSSLSRSSSSSSSTSKFNLQFKNFVKSISQNNKQINRLTGRQNQQNNYHYHRSSQNQTIRFRKLSNFLFCGEQIGSRVKRSFRSKWRVSVKEYAGRYYPPYCPGYSIVYSPDVLFRLYIEAQKTKYFWIDDVHITGTLAQQANITITSFRAYVLDEKECENILSGKANINDFIFLFAWPGISEQQIRDLWTLNMQNFVKSQEITEKEPVAATVNKNDYDNTIAHHYDNIFR